MAQFLVLTHRSTDFGDEQFGALIAAELDGVRRLYADDVVRSIWRRGDTPGAVLLVEADAHADVVERVSTLPMVRAGMVLTDAIVPLAPHAAFAPGDSS